MAPALEAVGKGLLPPMNAIVWPTGLDRSLLSQMPLTVRVRNCLAAAGLTNGTDSILAVTLLRIPNFGRTSLAEFLRPVDKYLIDCTLATDMPKRQSPEHAKPLDHLREAAGRRWRLADESLRSLLATSADVFETPTLLDVLRPELVRLAGRMGLDSALRSVGLHEAMLGTTSLPALVARRLRKKLDGFNEAQRTVVEARLVEPKAATLEEVGRQLRVTRERVRQIQRKLEPKIQAALGPELQVIAATLLERLDPVIRTDELDERVARIVPDASRTVATIFRNALVRAMGFTRHGGLYTNERAERVIRGVRARAREMADDVGLVREQDLVASLPDESWRLFWPWLGRLSALHSFHGSLALRDSAKARTKAALLSIGRPATKEEIGAVCGYEARKVGAHLSNVDSVVKADRDRWGLREWVDDEYDGIVGEIIQRIEEDGGVTTTERLLREIPAKFNVSPQSVRAYMQTPRFEVRNGSINLAGSASIRLRELADAAHGHDEHGAPFWTFVVEDRYFQGYSVVGLPPEFAKALGCEPDSGVDVRVENLPDCRALSLRWRLSSLTGASLGYVAEPLRLLGLQTGDRARVAITANRSLRLSPNEGNRTRPAQEADATLARMLKRRRAI